MPVIVIYEKRATTYDVDGVTSSNAIPRRTKKQDLCSIRQNSAVVRNERSDRCADKSVISQRGKSQTRPTVNFMDPVYRGTDFLAYVSQVKPQKGKNESDPPARKTRSATVVTFCKTPSTCDARAITRIRRTTRLITTHRGRSFPASSCTLPLVYDTFFS